MKNILRVSIISIIVFALIVVPSFAKTGKIINTDEVRFRAKASATEDSEVLGKISKGTLVEIIEKTTGWYKVKYNNQVGYINSGYLEEVSEEDSTTKTTENNSQNQSTNQENQSDKNQSQENNQNQSDKQDSSTITTENNVYEITEKVSVRLMPLINSNIINSSEKGIKCTLISNAGNWSYVEVNTIKGWVLRSKIKQVLSDNQNTNNNSENTLSNITTTTKMFDKTKIGYVNLESINVRKQPNTASELVSKLSLNTEVKILGEDGDWYLIELNKQNLYVFKSLLSENKI
ncbi:MAG TPA: SH3 domain-containing protein [Clostridia bacterium]|nr:SH3 domain-containing protein [Clostridia bacterium]